MITAIGPYEVKGELGRGAMAVVWRAWDPVLQREVAIKEPVRGSGMSDWLAGELDSLFLREGHAAARLNHPNIITVYAADVFDGRPAIVMEVLEGATLSELIDRKQLTPERIEKIWTQLLGALVYAHSMGVIHRDVKPDNIFVTSSNLVKLTDFGVANLKSTATSDYDQVIAGSPGYMPPEQAAGEVADARSDLFSFSVIAYEMLALNNPFGATEGLSREEILIRTQAADTLPAFEGLPQISAVIAKGMRHHPRERWQSGEHYRNALSKAMEQERFVFLAQRRGRPFPFKREDDANKSTELFSLDVSTGVNKNMLTGIVIAAVVLAGLIGVFAGIEALFFVVLFGAILSGAGWFLYHFKDRFGQGNKPPVAVNAQIGDAEGFYASGTLLPPLAKWIRIRVISPYGLTTVEDIEIPLTIGRDQVLGSHLLRDDLMSAGHLSLEYDGNLVYAHDVGSRNGTLINGRQLTGSEPLNEGAQIQVGRTLLEVLSL